MPFYLLYLKDGFLVIKIFSQFPGNSVVFFHPHLMYTGQGGHVIHPNITCRQKGDICSNVKIIHIFFCFYLKLESGWWPRLVLYNMDDIINAETF